jgi:hypothetical protein
MLTCSSSLHSHCGMSTGICKKPRFPVPLTSSKCILQPFSAYCHYVILEYVIFSVIWTNFLLYTLGLVCLRYLELVTTKVFRSTKKRPDPWAWPYDRGVPMCPCCLMAPSSHKSINIFICLCLRLDSFLCFVLWCIMILLPLELNV